MRLVPYLRRTPLLPLIGLGIVLMAGLAALALVESERRASGWIAHTLHTQLAIARFEQEVTRFESAYRGYLVRRTAPFMADVADSRGAAYAALARVAAETADNPGQRRRIARLRTLLDAKVRLGMQWVGYRGQSVSPRLAALHGEPGRVLTLRIRSAVRAMTAEEVRLLATRQAVARRLSLAVSGGLVLAVLAILLVAALMVRDAEARTRAMESARDNALEAERATADAAAARAAAEDKLRQMQKTEALGRLTGGIAHDFNNMLAIVTGSLDLAEQRADDRPRLLQAIDDARDGAARAAALTARLLAFARQSPLSPVAVDANRVVAGLSALLRPTLGETIAVETATAPGLWAIWADPGEVENALLNLAVNARDASARRLTITTANRTLGVGALPDMSATGDYVTITVADDGTGMAPDVAARAFDPFFTTKAVGKGTGLGLSQVFGFARQSGGHATIRSTPGTGTIVTLYLPRHETGADDGLAVTAGRAELPRGRDGEVVLVCEDDRRVRRMSADALAELGYDVVVAADGEEALRILATTPGVTLLFTDVIMPGLDGPALVERARALRPGLPVLYTTGYSGEAEGAEILAQGMSVLAKPFTLARLARRVCETIDERPVR